MPICERLFICHCRSQSEHAKCVGNLRYLILCVYLVLIKKNKHETKNRWRVQETQSSREQRAAALGFLRRWSGKVKLFRRQAVIGRDPGVTMRCSPKMGKLRLLLRIQMWHESIVNKSRNLQNNPKKTKWVPGHSEVPSSQPVGIKMAKERMWPSDGWLVGMEERKRWEQKRQKQRWVSVGRGKNVAGGKNHVRKGLGEENNTAQSPSQSLTMQTPNEEKEKNSHLVLPFHIHQQIFNKLLLCTKNR